MFFVLFLLNMAAKLHKLWHITKQFTLNKVLLATDSLLSARNLQISENEIEKQTLFSYVVLFFICPLVDLFLTLYYMVIRRWPQCGESV